MNISQPTITGVPQQGQTLTVQHGSWTRNPTSFTDNWLRCDGDGTNCTPITEAAGLAYTLTSADVGHTIVVREVASNADGPSAPSDSLPTAVVTAPIVGISSASPPTISGIPEAGQTLTENHAGWTPTPTSFSYQWNRCDGSGAACAPVGADSPTYTLSAADAGHTIVVQEQASGASPGQTGTATSAPTPIIVVRTATGLVATSTAPVVNQRISLIAFVTATVSGASPSGTISFSNAGKPLAGCVNEPVSPMGQTGTAVCDVSFAASAPALTAAFTPSAGSFMTPSQSPTRTISVGRDSTSTAIDVSKTTLVGQPTTYTATVAPPASRPGPVLPTGAVEFFDSGQPIAGCMRQPLVRGGATCTVTYRQPGAHTIKAVYGGDANFSGSPSAAQSTDVQRPPTKVLGTITATMQWSFQFTRSYTTVSALVVNGALRTTVSVQCQGRGCPFAKQTAIVKETRPCHQGTRRTCPTHGTLDLTPKFRNRRLSGGARFTVTIVRSNWIGKYYRFTMQRGKAPLVRIACLAPTATRPGVGC